MLNNAVSPSQIVLVAAEDATPPFTAIVRFPPGPVFILTSTGRVVAEQVLLFSSIISTLLKNVVVVTPKG